MERSEAIEKEIAIHYEEIQELEKCIDEHKTFMDELYDVWSTLKKEKVPTE